MSGADLFTGPVDDPTRYRVAAEDLDRAIAGGEGLVCRASVTATGDEVALKVLTAMPLADFPRLADRAAPLADVRHPNLMRHRETFVGCALGDGTTDDPADFDVPYSVADWVDGRPLVEAAADATVEERLGWIDQLAGALHHLHTHRGPGAPDGIVHRDLKPSNVRVDDDGDIVLLDYGVARPVAEDDMTKGIGTYLWRAPEVLSGRNASVGTASDVWGLGAIAHWLLVGEPPGLDGAAASRERIEAALRADGYERGHDVAVAVAELLRSNPTDRPRDLEVWARRASTREPGVLRRVVLVAAMLAAVAVLGTLLRSGDDGGGDSASLTGTTMAATVAGTTVEASLPQFVWCLGRDPARLDADPPIGMSRENTMFKVTGQSTPIFCKDDHRREHPFDLTFLAFAFPQFGCSSLAPGADGRWVLPKGRGNATVMWDDAKVSALDVEVEMTDVHRGTMTITVIDGWLRGYRGDAFFTVPLSAWVGNCSSGLTQNTGATLDAITFYR